MEKIKYIAHKTEDNREQTVLDHLMGTAALCGEFSAAFGTEEQGRLAGMAHDIGKYSEAFQRRLSGSSLHVDHATAGAWECIQLEQPLAAFAVSGHHGGLPDGGAQGDHPEKSTFLARMNRARQGRLEAYGVWRQEVSLPSAPFPDVGGSQAEGMFFTRMLYSCLVDADFLDTETFMNGAPADRGGGDTMEVLDEKLQGYLAKEKWVPPKTPLNEQRCAILSRCLEQGKTQPPGLFTLTIPTGGGKTVASLGFALRHAAAHGLRRVIYVLPYTSIIEQNARVFREILGPENVLEHHAGVQYDLDKQADPKSARMAMATENWDMPVVVTTAVQFFESLFACRSSRCRKLHNLAGSVIIFDEAQMLPFPYLQPCVFAIAQLVRRYRVSAVLCTATQPALEPIFREFLPGRAPVELCPAGTYQAGVFRRVTFQTAGSLSWPELAERMNGVRQVLCVVNRRKSAQTVYRQLSPEGRFHLSTLMCPKHRESVLEEIRRRLDDNDHENLPCRVVSTSLIEAGVDVDFPAVFREEAGLDSMLQAAGRCNRNGKRPVEASPVVLFQGDEAPSGLFSTNIDAGRKALRCCPQLDAPEAMECYFDELLALKGKTGRDQQGILPLMENQYHFMPFQTVAERFHLIENNTRTIYIPWREGAEIIQRLKNGERSRALFRLAGQYSVEVYLNHFQDLDNAGALTLLEDGSAVLEDLSLYEDSVGLTAEVETGRGIIS